MHYLKVNEEDISVFTPGEVGRGPHTFSVLASRKGWQRLSPHTPGHGQLSQSCHQQKHTHKQTTLRRRPSTRRERMCARCSPSRPCLFSTR